MENVSIYELAWELARLGVSTPEIVRRLGKHRVTVYRWLKGIKYRGIKRFVKEKKEAKRKRKRRCLDTRVVLKIKKIRKQTGWCGEKIVWELRHKYDVVVSKSSVYRVLNRYFKLRSKWKKNVARGPQPKAVKPRDVIQADTVDLGGLFAYTAIDIFTREALIVLGDTLEAKEGAKCVRKILKTLGSCQIFQTDNGGEFGYECSQIIKQFALRHRKIHARRKNENAFIESFHRSLRKECVGWMKYTKKDKSRLQALINQYLIHYHTERPHLGLGLKTPAEVAMLHLP
ncbi:MAG: Putative Transposase [Microgenomates bacterium 39_7]|nr:MAG: Putative Transposase [Microgenomates bacterium 39_7]